MTDRLRATARLQLHADFDFAALQGQLDYYSRLGVSHLYLSPITTARPGSRHGYDVVDYSRVNPELGGEAGLRSLAQAARRHGLGLVVDFVPNHMAVNHGGNAQWHSVLEWGRGSRHARFFDIDWAVPDPLLRNRVLLPILPRQYGEVLAAGELVLGWQPAENRLGIACQDRFLPLNPRHYSLVLASGDALLQPWAEEFRQALSGPASGRQEHFDRLRLELAEAARAPELAGALSELAELWAVGQGGRRRLHWLLQRQHYRLAWWRTAGDDINWRRFFDITDLAGVRVEERTVFDEVHCGLLRWYAEGLIDGVRIDHVDGLADPGNYCRRLRHRLNHLRSQRPGEGARLRPLIWVEKILAPGERLDERWQVDGTTGYSFMNDVSALLHSAGGEAPLERLWQQLAPEPQSFAEVERQARRRLARELLGADFRACVRALLRLARARPETQDWTPSAIERVLMELLVAFPVYRTYADASGRSPGDEAIMASARAEAATRCRPSERPLLAQLDAWLGGEPPRDIHPPSQRRARLQALARFQQLTSPLAAKAVEDTAFYRHGRLLSRNEVGATPLEFSLSPEAFMERCRRRQEHYPRALLATATHDHKRGGEVRMRLAVLSERPRDWAREVIDWQRLNRRAKVQVDGRPAPDAIDEYMLYQMLVGAWPLDLEPGDSQGLTRFQQRMAGWQHKALREARRLSGWLEPNEDYEAAAATFLGRLLDLEFSTVFLQRLHRQVQELAAAGAVNSLAQTLLQYTAPGVPDLYQGTELWDFSLVDPDNRAAVDLAPRRAALAEPASLTALRERWREGGIKLRLIHGLLSLRRDHPDLFEHGSHVLLPASGPAAARMMLIHRHHGARHLLAAVPRGVAGWVTEALEIPPGHWQGSELELPAELAGLRWQHAMDRSHCLQGARLPLAELLPVWPVGLWLSGV